MLLIDSEREVDAEVDRGVAVERQALFGKLAEGAVHAQEQVEAGGVQIGYPAESYAVGAS